MTGVQTCALPIFQLDFVTAVADASRIDGSFAVTCGRVHRSIQNLVFGAVIIECEIESDAVVKHTEVESRFVIGRNLRFEILIIERRRYNGRSGEIACAIIGRCLVRVCVVADLCQRTSHFQQTDLDRKSVV